MVLYLIYLINVPVKLVFLGFGWVFFRFDYSKSQFLSGKLKINTNYYSYL